MRRMIVAGLFVMCLSGCAPSAARPQVATPSTGARIDTSSVFYEGVGRIDTAHSPETERQRDELEGLLLSGKGGHDAVLQLSSIADTASVPALLVALRSSAGDCTSAHALDALRLATKSDVGRDYESWKAWWDEYLRSHPAQ